MTGPDASACLTELVRQSDERCPVCDALLHEVTGGRCGACEVELVVAVGSPDRRLGPWIVALTALALPTGFWLMGCLAWIVQFLRFGGRLGQQQALVTTFFLAAIGWTVASALFIVWRRMVWRRTRPRQWMLSAIIALISLGSFAAILSEILP